MRLVKKIMCVTEAILVSFDVDTATRFKIKLPVIFTPNW